MDGIADLYLGIQKKEEKKEEKAEPAVSAAAEVDPAVYAVYAGKYRVDNGDILVVSVQENKLFIQPPDTFKRSYGTIDFSRDNAGKVTGFAFNQGGDLKELIFTKR